MNRSPLAPLIAALLLAAAPASAAIRVAAEQPGPDCGH